MKGSYKGIHYEYTSGTTVRKKSVFIRMLYNLIGFTKSIIRILELRKRGLGAILLIGPLGFSKEIIYFILCKIIGIKFIQERTEYPFIISKNNFFTKINLWIYLNLSCKLYDSLLVISKPLKEYFAKYVSKKTRIFILPIVVNPERFTSVKKIRYNSDYIAYCGSMQSDKDGINYLLEAFSIIRKKFQIKLKLVGKTDFNGFSKFKEQIEKMNLSSEILFTGRVTNEEMANILANAKLLVLARPATIQAQGNFPTKIGEYLATGNPIVTTKVGEINEYLRDGINAYLAKPGDSADFAKKIEEALVNGERSMQIGLEGQKLAQKEFNYLYQGKKLAEFLNITETK